MTTKPKSSILSVICALCVFLLVFGSVINIHDGNYGLVALYILGIVSWVVILYFVGLEV